MSGGLKFWQRYAHRRGLGKPVIVLATPTGYVIQWAEHNHRKATPFVGPEEKKQKLIRELERWGE